MKRIHLLFVYNADSDLFSSVTGFVHKIISPQTYKCNLCALTYGNVTMKQEWKIFLEDLPAETFFLHKDQFEKQYNQPVELPAIFHLKEDFPVVLISSSEIDNFPSIQELIGVLLQKIQSLQTTLV